MYTVKNLQETRLKFHKKDLKQKQFTRKHKEGGH